MNLNHGVLCALEEVTAGVFNNFRTSSAFKRQVTHDLQPDISTWPRKDSKSILCLPLTTIMIRLLTTTTTRLRPLMTITIRKVKFPRGPSQAWSPKCIPSHWSSILAPVINSVSEFPLLMGLSPPRRFYLPAACQHLRSPGLTEVLRRQHLILHPNVAPTVHMEVKATWGVLSWLLQDGHPSFFPLPQQDSLPKFLNTALVLDLSLMILSLVTLFKISRYLVKMILPPLLPDLSGYVELVPSLSSRQQCHHPTRCSLQTPSME